MADTQMIPFNTDGGGWSDAVSAFGGAFLGSWFTNGWNGNGYGRGPVAGVAAVESAAADTVILDGLSNITNQLCGVNTTLLNSQAAQNQAFCQGFNGINTAINQTSAQTQQGLCQGFNSVADVIQNTSAQTRFENMTGFSGLERSIANCCCTTQTNMAKGFGDLALENCQNTGHIVNAIGAEGTATRALINQNYINDLQTQLCDAKSKIGALESQNFTAGVIANQSQIFDAKLANAVNTIIAHTHTTK